VGHTFYIVVARLMTKTIMPNVRERDWSLGAAGMLSRDGSNRGLWTMRRIIMASIKLEAVLKDVY